MNILSGILGQVARALGGVSAPYETNINIPAQLLPIISLRNVFTGTAVAGPTNSTSGAKKLTTVANGGGVADVFIILNPGLWEIWFACHYTANYIDVGATPNAGLVLTNANGTRLVNLTAFIATGAAAQSSVSQFGKIVVNVADEIYNIQNTVAANGAGQTHSLMSTVLAQKLT